MSIVSIVRCPDYDEERVLQAVTEALAPLGGIEKFVRPGAKVVIKPNLLMKKDPGEVITTHPAVVQALSKLALRAGGSVTLAESPGTLYTEGILKGVYAATGMRRVAEAEGMALNLDCSSREVDNPRGALLKRVTIISPLADADVVINVPKMKSHGQMVFTGAVKNMFGAVPGVYKAEYHLRMADCNRFADVLIDIFLCVGPALTVMDAVTAMDGDGPASGDPKSVGLVLAAENAFDLDTVAVAIAGADPLKVPVLANAVRRGLCAPDLGAIEIAGETLEAVKVPDFRLPALESRITITWVQRGPLRFLIDRLRPSPRFHHDRCVGCGECARACPAGIITMKETRPHADLRRCIRCFCCQELCPRKAVSIRRPLLTRLFLRQSKSP